MKKLTAVLLTAAMLLSFTFANVSATQEQDNDYTIGDVLEILKHLAGMVEFTHEQVAAYDFYDKGEVSISTVLELLKYLAGMESVVDTTGYLPHPKPVTTAEKTTAVTTTEPVTVTTTAQMTTPATTTALVITSATTTSAATVISEITELTTPSTTAHVTTPPPMWTREIDNIDYFYQPEEIEFNVAGFAEVKKNESVWGAGPFIFKADSLYEYNAVIKYFEQNGNCSCAALKIDCEHIVYSVEINESFFEENALIILYSSLCSQFEYSIVDSLVFNPTRTGVSGNELKKQRSWLTICSTSLIPCTNYIEFNPWRRTVLAVSKSDLTVLDDISWYNGEQDICVCSNSKCYAFKSDSIPDYKSLQNWFKDWLKSKKYV
jgi:hypothetical protein